MLKSKNKRYSVRDVLSILEDGASEFEYESGDETDSESDDGEPAMMRMDDRDDAEEQAALLEAYDAETDIEDAPTNQPAATATAASSSNADYVWRSRAFHPPDTTFTGNIVDQDVQTIHTPLQYFNQFVTPEMLDELVITSNQYTMQKTGKSMETTRKELEVLLGIYFRMGLAKMPGYRAYWEEHCRYDPVASVMTRNRFLQLIKGIHFVNNLDDHDDADKCWIIRPWLKNFLENCLKVTPDEHNSIDEMMIPFKGKFSRIKQYIRGKPNPWGIKLWARTSSTGILYDFDVYQGKVGNTRPTEVGVGGEVVLKLCSTLDEGKNYKIYADNFFTSVPLVDQLSKKQIFYLGTVRSNRIKGCIMQDDKSLLRRGRGTHEAKVEKNRNICAIKWVNTKVVSVLSSMVGATPTEKVQRWSVAEKKYIDVERPYALSVYNQYMGGVDIPDSYLATYRKSMVSRRWYLYLYWHTIYIGMVNAWLLYKRDCAQQQVPVKEIMIRRKFQAQLASSLVAVNVSTRKRGRPSLDNEVDGNGRQQRIEGLTRLRAARVSLPADDVRLDEMGHLPEKIARRGKCRLCKKGITNTYCSKCKARLCFMEQRNCFKSFHTEK